MRQTTFLADVCFLSCLALLTGSIPLDAAEPSLAAQSPPAAYDLSEVHGGDRFSGPREARRLLEQQGFVVTDEQFKQVFQAYLSYGAPLPRFVTTDSIWHTYHVLLEEGVRRLEERQSTILAIFSERLYRQARAKAAQAEAAGADHDRQVYHDLALFAAVAWAFQQPKSLETLDGKDREISEKTATALRQGSPPRRVLFFGLPVMPERYRAVSLYTKTPWLADYFAARQWYATNVFRRQSDTETERAIQLALLVQSDKELTELYKQLTKPYDALLGPADDAAVREYAKIAGAVFGEDTSPKTIADRLDDFRTAAADLPVPRVNDQYLAPEEYDRFAERTQGFRLLPSRRVPSATLFQRTVDPTVKGRMFPSGIDVFATGSLASEAARDALRKAVKTPAVAQTVLATECAPLPDSLHGKSLKLLTQLQTPLPDTAPQPLRTTAWHDKQLWTQLGAWAEQRHTWALHTKLNAHWLGITREPPGYVSPYPEFYRGLGQLARDTGPAIQFEENERARAVRAGRIVIEAAAAARKIEKRSPSYYTPFDEDDLEPLRTLGDIYPNIDIRREPEGETVIESAYWLPNPDFADRVARRWIEDDNLTEKDREAIGELLDHRFDPATYFEPFAKVCDRLAEIAEKELAAKPLDNDDAEFIRDYGKTLAKFHFYHGNSYLHPRDDFPMVVPVFSSPLGNRDEFLYAGLARPEAVYVIVDVEDKPVLHRGAVISYREFRQPINEALGDDSWTEQVRRGDVPPPPPFTTSFRRTMSQRESIGAIRSGQFPPQLRFADSPEITAAMLDVLIAGNTKKESSFCSHVFRRAKDEHVGRLLEFIDTLSAPDRSLKSKTRDAARCIEKLDFGPHRDTLYKLLHHETIEVGDAAAYLLGGQPGALNDEVLREHFERGKPTARRFVCYLLGQLKQPSSETAALLLSALGDEFAVVRYQAVVAILNWHLRGINLDKLSPRFAERLLELVRGKNSHVGSAATRLLVLIEKSDSAPALLKLLMEETYIERDWSLPNRCKDEVRDHPRHSATLYLMALGTERFPRPAGQDGDKANGSETSIHTGRDKHIAKWLQDLPAEIISALAAFDHQPAVPQLRRMLRRGAEMEQLPHEQRFIRGFGPEAVDALVALGAAERTALLKQVAADRTASPAARIHAIRQIGETFAPQLANVLIPLLDPISPIPAEADTESRVREEAAGAIGSLLDFADADDPKVANVRKAAIDKLTVMCPTPSGPAAVEALAQIEGERALPRLVNLAINREMPINTRAKAVREFRNTVWSRQWSDDHEPGQDGEATESESANRRYLHQIVPHVKRLAPVLQDKTHLKSGQDSDKRLCDFAASVIADALELKRQSPNGRDLASRDEFVNHVRQAIERLSQE